MGLNILASSPNRISWKYFKVIVKDDECLENIVNIANTCINLSYWLMYFKLSPSIIISKPNKAFYNSLKSFCSIVLLNMLENLIEKVVGEHLQFHSIANNFVYPNQLRELKQ